MEKTNEKQRKLYIDLIRVIAVISVLVCHYTRGLESVGVGYQNKILPDTVFDVYLGSYGVSLFFIVSGASLMLVYGNHIKIKDYFKKRFLGIYPMFWIAYTIAFLLLFYMNKTIDHSIPKSRILLTIVGMDGYLNWFAASFYILGEWFLGCIIILYCLFPLIRKAIISKPVITGIVITLVYVIVSIFFSSRMPTECFFILRIPEFALGMYYVRYIKQTNLGTAIFSLVILIVFAILDFSAVKPIYNTTIVGMASFFVISYISKYLEYYYIRKICSTVGKYAFAVFLTHHVIIGIYLSHFKGVYLSLLENYLVLIILLVIVALVSLLLYKINEIIMKIVKEMLNRLKTSIKKEKFTKNS